MNKIKTFIMAGGEGSRWKNYLGVPKHQIEVSGEKLVDRIARQFGSWSEVVLVGDYKINGIESIKSSGRGKTATMELLAYEDKYSLKVNQGRTIVVHGDVWLTDEAVEVIKNTSECESGYMFFGREKFNDVCPYGEIWAFSFIPKALESMRGIAREVKKIKENTKEFFSPNAWKVYRGLRGIDYLEHRVVGAWAEIDDLTEDFDFPADYDNWIIKYKKIMGL